MTEAAMASSEPSNRLKGRRWLNSQPRPIDQARTSAILTRITIRMIASSTGHLLQCTVHRATIYCSDVLASATVQIGPPTQAHCHSGRQRVMVMQSSQHGLTAHTKGV